MSISSGCRMLFCVVLTAACVMPRPSVADEPPHRIAHVTPESLRMRTDILSHIDAVVQEGLQRQAMPGCVVTIGRRDGIVFQQAWGFRQVQPEKVAMTTDTVFDLASLTKPLATATSIMVLIERGEIDPSATVASVLPEFAANGKQDVTILQLLTHQSGLIPDNALADYQDGPEQAFARINQLSLQSDPDSQFRYSDVGFLVLGEIVRHKSGRDVHQFSQSEIFAPLAMQETGYLPSEPLKERAAVTEQRDGHWMQGEVHDPRAFLLNGVAGHAGLFSTGDDLAKYAVMMLNHGRLGTVQILNDQTFALMTRPVDVGSGLRSPGWDVKSGYSSNRGDLFSDQAFGHGGFTGTSIWIDPGRDLFVIFLSNRVHPDGKGAVNSLAGRIGTIAAAAILPDEN